MENQQLENEKQNSPEAAAKRILAKAAYISKLASDKELSEVARQDLVRAMYYLHKAAYELDICNAKSSVWLWLRMMSKELGLE
jgi:hypothetical protein